MRPILALGEEQRPAGGGEGWDPGLLASSPRRIRQSNAVTALHALHRFRRLTRADLARKMGLNRSSSGSIIAELTGAGFVREVEAASRGPGRRVHAGRPGILIEMVPEAACFVGAEIGVEHVATVEIDLTAGIVQSAIEPFDGCAVGVEEAVARAVAQAFRDLPPSRLARCEGFGLSAPAQMGIGGHVTIAPILGWRDVDLTLLARRALPARLPVVVENDANAFAIGATYSQSEARSGVTVFLLIESGVGGGITIDGVLFRGGHGLAGEVGHLHAAGSGETIEQLLGLGHLLAGYRACRALPAAGLAELLADVRDRVPAAVAIAEEWARVLALAIVQIARVIDPGRVVLGGSVAALYPMVAARVAAHIQALQAPTFPMPEILLNEAAAFGSAFGAACMMHQRFLSHDNGLLADEPPDRGG